MKSTLSKPKAITLIALVITIVIIIILAGITINLSIGENGIFKKAKVAREQYLNAQVSEEKGINELYAQIFVANDGTVTIDATKLQELIQNEVKKATAGSTSNPAGTVIAYMNDDAPTGYLACNGQAVSRTEYAELFTAIGTKYGEGDGSTTFNVPDLRGEFLRGAGTAARDTGTGASVGTHQDGTWIPWVASYENSILQMHTSATNAITQVANPDKTTSTNYYRNYNADVKSTYEGSKPSHYTSRPTNTSVLYCIKY